jgi:hypothetical protein
MRGSILGALAVLAASPALAGSFADVSVEVAGSPAPLYHATDGSGRLYFEAREGRTYTLRIANRTHERIGALVVVDGLNAISGEREVITHGRPGRMYVLGAWETVEVRGWRTSLEQVRQFTFVDERASYAARTGKANRRMGWVEIAVYRERHPVAMVQPRRQEEYSANERASDEPPAEAASAPSAKAERADGASRGGVLGGVVGGRDRGYPGTGWGQAAYDPAMVVSFEAAPRPAERINLRYEYASALRALGILPAPHWTRDRLRERDRGDGFARPPRW